MKIRLLPLLLTSALLTAAAAACSSSNDAATGVGGSGAGPDASSSAASSTVSASSSSTTSSSSTAGSGGGGGDALTTSFVFVGCNRLSKGDWDPATNPSSANVAELQQTFTDIAALPTAPSLFFFTGDLVLGLDDTPMLLSGQLDAWAGLFAASPISKLDLVPLPGNHEMLVKQKVNGTKIEFSNTDADGVWTAWIGNHGFDSHAGNGPTSAAPNADALQDDQSKLSYSFDRGNVHYVVLNTDTWTTTPDAATGLTQIGWVALDWLTKDLKKADANPATDTIFVLGHKPLVAPPGVTGTDATIAASLIQPMEALFDGTTKMKGYLCAHAHQWDAEKLPGKRGVFQVIAGNGGSALEATWAPANGTFFGFTEVRLYKSGRAGVVSYGRPVPSPYNAAAAMPAVAGAEVTIAP